MSATSTATAALHLAVYFLDRGFEPATKARAFSRAADVVAGLDDRELRDRAEAGTLTELDGIGPSTASVIADAVLGRTPEYLTKLDERTRLDAGAGSGLLERCRSDLHSHSTWSDGGASVRTMAATARALGRTHLALTDHSPRLTVAHGLTPERLADQLEEVAALNAELAPFRILTGCEVDILADGSLDLPDDVLAGLDVVVASAHSKLSMPERQMTERLVRAVASPHVDILGHCTGRMLTGRGRPPSSFDAELVFAACAQFGTAVELNCRPERQDPPDDLLDLALEWNCFLSVDSDAHSPGQLEWVTHGYERLGERGIDPDRILTTWDADALLDWCAPVEADPVG
ncbi:MAG: PHP domain-containing protein [Microthrixaceae bacterium]